MNKFRFTILFVLIALVWVFLPFKTFALTISKTPANTLQDGLVGWWTMDGKDTNATQALDKSVYGNNMTRCPMSFINGEIGQAASFIRNQSALKGSNSAVLSPGTGNFTMSAWVRANVADSNYHYIYHDLGASNNNLGFLIANSGKFQAFYIDGNTNETRLNSPDVVVANKWYYVATTKVGTTTYLYVNGQLVDTKSNALLGNIDVSGSNEPEIGAYSGNCAPGAIIHSWSGKIDDVRIYNRALSISEIQQLYKMGGGVIAKTDTTRPTLKTGLVGWWTMDGKDFLSATSIKDKGSSGNTSTLNGGVTKINGKIGQALKFDGSTGFVDIGLPNYGKTYSVGMWVKGTKNNSVFMGDANGNSYSFWYYNNKIYTAAGNNYTGGWDYTINNNWHHLVVTRNGTATANLYIDGVSYGSKDMNGNSDFTPTRIGDGHFYPWLGIIDDVRVYNRALSPTEIAELYTQGGGKISKTDLVRSQLRTGLVGHWTFDGKDWASSLITLDKSGYNNNGTLSGGVTKINGKIGQAVKFNGTNGKISSSNIPLISGNFTLCAWINAKGNPNSARSGVFEIGAGSSGFGLWISSDSGPDRYIVYRVNSNYHGAGLLYALNKWEHYCLRYTGSRMQILRNGSQVYDTAFSENPVAGSTASIGCRGDGAWCFNGLLDDARVYNRALSNAEIYELYRMGK